LHLLEPRFRFVQFGIQLFDVDAQFCQATQ
jgi:hypothetical protein